MVSVGDEKQRKAAALKKQVFTTEVCASLHQRSGHGRRGRALAVARWPAKGREACGLLASRLFLAMVHRLWPKVQFSEVFVRTWEDPEWVWMSENWVTYGCFEGQPLLFPENEIFVYMPCKSSQPYSLCFLLLKTGSCGFMR